MKSEKIYEFAINNPLNATRRKAVEKYILTHPLLSQQAATCGWDEEDPDTLKISVPPAAIDVRFQPKLVEVYLAAPFWAKLLLTEQKKAELSTHIEELLHKAKFITK